MPTLRVSILWLYALMVLVILLLNAASANPCDGVGAVPKLYHEYREDECPAPSHLVDPNGICETAKQFPECIGFCQVRTNFFYATESPFPRTDCHYPLKCSLSTSASTSWSWSFSPSIKIFKAIKIGISGSYSRSGGSTEGHSWEFEPNPGECGYFTFVPIMKDTCGSLTSCTSVLELGGCFTDYVTIPNYCVPQVWMIDGKPDGTVIFVKTNCLTREPLGPEFQDPIYQQPNVALPRSVSASIQKGWAENTCKITSQQTTESGILFTFEIRGVSFAYDQVGEQGENLKSNLDNCTANKGVTSWTFTWTRDDPNFDFMAGGVAYGSNEVPNCIGDSVIKVGGVMRDDCVSH